MGIPVVCLMIEGGISALESACESVNLRLPLVVCNGSGRASNVFSDAVLEYRELMKSVDESNRRSKLLNLQIRIEDQLRRFVVDEVDHVNFAQLSEKMLKSFQRIELVSFFMFLTLKWD